MIDELVTKVEATEIVVCMSCPTRRYWRHDLFSGYKSNRTGRAPIILLEVKKHLETAYNSFVRPGLEADDILGILSTHPTLGGKGRKVIVSTDKDFKTIPGLFFDMGKGTLLTITEEDADYWHMMQTLMGDQTDGYPGCPGVGVKTAEKILKPTIGHPAGMWQSVLQAFGKKDMNEKAALTQARLARICRAGDYDFKKRKVILWEPPNIQK